MEIFQFEQFQMIAECGTMREAAERLYLSQPTLSHNLKKLESELGCQLFVRTRNKLKLTPYGEVVLAHTREIDCSFKAMLAEVKDMQRREAATLHIGCFSLLASAFLMPQIAAEMPDSRFEVTSCATADLVAGLEEGRFDVLIATDICRKKSLRWRKLYREQAYLSVPKDGRLAHVAAVTADDLAECSYDIEEGLAGYSDWYGWILQRAGVSAEAIRRNPLRQHLKTKDALPTCNLITSLIMSFVRTSENRAIIRIDEDFAQRNVGLVFRADASEKVQAFTKYVHSKKDRLLSGNTFIPYFLYPEDAGNLHIVTE